MEEVWEKRQTIDPEVRAYVYSLVNAVGGSSTYDDTYQVGDDAYTALQDILRWLRLYDEKLNRFDVKRCLAEANLVKGDLLEVLALWPEEAQDNKLKSKLALACLQLLVPLTWPPELEDDKTTVNHHRHLPYLQLAQVGYKRAVLHYEHAKILRTAVRVGLPSMAQRRRERSKRDEGIVKLVLYLFRNMVMITQPQMLPAQGDENEVSRSTTIGVFGEQDVFSLLLTVGSGANDEFQDHDVILLEIFFHLLKGVDAKKLFPEQHQMQREETNELRTLMQKEKAMHKSYNRHAPSRHNRFGTMLWVKRDDEKMSTLTGQASIVDGDATLLKMDQSKRWDKPKYRGKQAQSTSAQADFCEKVDLDESARKRLRSFVEDFLDSGFNPLFSSLRKAIERETDRVSEVHKRQYFYLINWFLSAENARHGQTSRNGGAAEDNTFAYVAAVLDQETFVLLNRHMQRAFDEKNWVDLQATLLAFTQILLTVQSMVDSKDEEDQEIAENIQNRIFYEEATHDRVVQILRGYTNQGFAYLDAVTECVHVFVRMLERYSKQNADLHIRSKRRARRKTKKSQANTTNADDNDPEDAAEDEREAFASVSERKFDFSRFSAKFLSQPCVNTFIALLHFYADLTPDQLKRCHRYLYRLAFKHELVILLFRVDVLLLLHRMIKGPGSLSTEVESYKDWEQLIQQVFRRCIRWMGKERESTGWKEMCVVEMLFSKVPNTVFYLQNGNERVVEKKAPRPPAELEVKGSVEEGMRLPVAVSLMLEQGKGEALDWVKGELRRAVEEREAWGRERAARESGGRHGEDVEAGIVLPPPPSVFLSPDTDERKMQMFKDKHLRLLLTTLGLERLGLAEDVDASWVIPSELSTQQLQEALEAIQKTEFDPPAFDDGKTVADLIRNKSSAAHRTTNPYDSASDSEAASGADLDAPLFPPNLRSPRKDGADRPPKRRGLTKRNSTALTEAEAAERAAERARKERERQKKYKSELYVTALDEESDEEADKEFFRLEEERRRRMEGVIRGWMVRGLGEGVGKGKGKKGGKGGGVGKGGGARKRKSRVGSDGLEEEEGSSSPIRKRAAMFEQDSDASGEEESGSVTARKRLAMFEQDSEASDGEDSGPLLVKKQRRDPFEQDRDAADDASDTEFFRARPAFIFRPHERESEDERVSDAEEQTPSTSPMVVDKPADGQPLAEVSGSIGTPRLGTVGKAAVGDGHEDDEDDVPVGKPAARRGVRAGFIVDSDSE